MTKKIVLVLAVVACLARAATVLAQAPAAQPEPAAAAAPPAAAAVALTDADLKAAVKPTDRANGDPDGSLTGTVNDIAIADAKVGLTLSDVLNQIGANRIGVNFAWTLLCGFLIMFMQAGFAVVEAGPVPREERQPHHDDELHGVRRRHARLLPHRLPAADGRRRGHREPRLDTRSSTRSSSSICSARTSACSATRATS